MQALINKINKSIVAPLPTKYSGAFRGLVKSMLWKNPELRPTAGELLGHPHLQPFVLKINRKLNNHRRSTLPGVLWSESNNIKKTRFSEPEVAPFSNHREKRRSFSNDRTLNSSISGTELDSVCYTKGLHDTPDYLNQRIAESSIESSHEGTVIYKPIASKLSHVAKTPRCTPSKVSATPRRQTEPLRNRESLPVSHTPKKSAPATRRASLPLAASATIQDSPFRTNVSILHHIKSPDVSVNEPRIDRIAEFPLASYEESFFPIRRTLSTSAQGSSGSHNVVTVRSQSTNVQFKYATKPQPSPVSLMHGREFSAACFR